MPAKAKAPISHVLLDEETGKPTRMITYNVGDHIPDDDHVLLKKHGHGNAMVRFEHDEHACPHDCSKPTCPARNRLANAKAASAPASVPSPSVSPDAKASGAK